MSPSPVIAPSSPPSPHPHNYFSPRPWWRPHLLHPSSPPFFSVSSAPSASSRASQKGLQQSLPEGPPVEPPPLRWCPHLPPRSRRLPDPDSSNPLRRWCYLPRLLSPLQQDLISSDPSHRCPPTSVGHLHHLPMLDAPWSTAALPHTVGASPIWAPSMAAASLYEHVLADAALKVLSDLAYIHRYRIVHHDFKPSNPLINDVPAKIDTMKKTAMFLPLSLWSEGDVATTTTAKAADDPHLPLLLFANVIIAYLHHDIKPA